MGYLVRARLRRGLCGLTVCALLAACSSTPGPTATPSQAASATSAVPVTSPPAAAASTVPATAAPATAPPSSPTSPPSVGPVPETAPATTPAPSQGGAFKDTLTFLTYRGDYTLTKTSENSMVVPFIYDALYRLDDSFAPVPDLATEPCTVAADLVTITCHVHDALFHDGSALTADDVVFTYQLSASPECAWAGADTAYCIGDRLTSVRAVDKHTVEFVLKEPDPTVLNELFSSVGIDSRGVVTAQFDALMAKAGGHDPDGLDKAADAVDTETSKDAPDCAKLLDPNDAFLTQVGVTLIPRDFYDYGEAGTFDPCSYASDQRDRLHAVASALRADGIDAIAAAYPALPIQQQPVGTGAWKLTQLTSTEVDLVDFPEGFHGPPATPNVRFRVYDTVDDVKKAFDDGELSVALFIDAAGDPSVLDRDPSIESVQYIFNAFTYLAYNVRPGMLFADTNLRRAMELCVDKERTVESVTGGTGAAIYSPITPASWAYADDLPRTQRDVAAARALIESSGWTVGADGIYRKDGRRLATKVWVRADADGRIHFLQLLAAQEQDCGIDLSIAPADFGDLADMIGNYPHDAPGTKHPFDAYLGGAGLTSDPADDTAVFDSGYITGPDNPSFDPFSEAANFTGYSDPEVDALLHSGRTTYDQRERARIYVDFQHAIAERQPYLFAWSPLNVEYRAPGMTSTLGPLAPDAPNWWHQLETLEVPAQ
jgi:ABC-type transport system substrate-binding protein